MNDLILDSAVHPLDGYDAPMYLIDENSRISVTEYKMMENIRSLLPCRQTSLNGIAQLAFLTADNATLNVLYSQMSEERLLGVIRGICDGLAEIRSNGFMRWNKVVFSIDKIYVHPSDNLVKLIYLPVEDGSNNSLSIAEINSFLLSIVEKSEAVNNQTINAIRFFAVTNPEATLDDLKHFYNNILGSGGADMKDPQTVEPEKKQIDSKKALLQLILNDAGLEKTFIVDKARFTFGKKESAVDGYIPNNPYLSRVHCEVIREDNRYFVSDMGSRNGTYVNKVKLRAGEKKELHDGDLLRLSTCSLSVVIREG